jgi:FAD/FMN-containing dehydrogenase
MGRYIVLEGPTRPSAIATRAGAGVTFAVDPDPSKAELLRKWTIDYWEALHPYSAGGAYVNFMMEEGQSRVRATYRDNFERLSKIKNHYDPGNLFRVNQNILPS